MAHETQGSISRWADATFGPVDSCLSIFKRAKKEWRELERKLEADPDHPGAAEEAVDILIVFCRLWERLGVSCLDEVDRKMAINRARKWVLDGEGHGQHVEGT